jgi:hypothetical protein
LLSRPKPLPRGKPLTIFAAPTLRRVLTLRARGCWVFLPAIDLA